MPRKLANKPPTPLDRIERQRLERRWGKEHPSRTHELREVMMSRVASAWPADLAKDPRCYRAWRRAVGRWKRQLEDGEEGPDCYEVDVIPPSVTVRAAGVRQKIGLPPGTGQWVQRWVERRLIFGDAQPEEHEDAMPKGWLEIEARAMIPGHPAAYVKRRYDLSNYTVGELAQHFDEAQHVVIDQLTVRWPAKGSQQNKSTKETHDERHVRLMVDSEFVPQRKRRSLESLATDEPVTLNVRRVKRSISDLKNNLGLTDQ